MSWLCCVGLQRRAVQGEGKVAAGDSVMPLCLFLLTLFFANKIGGCPVVPVFLLAGSGQGAAEPPGEAGPEGDRGIGAQAGDEAGGAGIVA